MPSEDEISDSPIKWVNQHVTRYRQSRGKNGHKWQGLNTLLITTRGRKTGKLRRTALIYGRDGERFVVVGSNGGKDQHPAWYHNILAQPEIHVQVEAEEFTAHARPAAPEERPRLWAMMAAIFPQYERFQHKTTRQLPVVVIERAE